MSQHSVCRQLTTRNSLPVSVTWSILPRCPGVSSWALTLHQTLRRQTLDKSTSHTVQCALEIQSACYSKTQMQNTSKQMAFKYVKKILITLTCIRYVHGHPLRMGMKLLIPQTIFLLCTSTRLRRIRTDAGHQLVTDQHLQALKHLLLSLFYVFVWLRFVNLY